MRIHKNQKALILLEELLLCKHMSDQAALVNMACNDIIQMFDMLQELISVCDAPSELFGTCEAFINSRVTFESKPVPSMDLPSPELPTVDFEAGYQEFYEATDMFFDGILKGDISKQQQGFTRLRNLSENDHHSCLGILMSIQTVSSAINPGCQHPRAKSMDWPDGGGSELCITCLKTRHHTEQETSEWQDHQYKTISDWYLEASKLQNTLDDLAACGLISTKS